MKTIPIILLIMFTLAGKIALAANTWTYIDPNKQVLSFEDRNKDLAAYQEGYVRDTYILIDGNRAGLTVQENAVDLTREYSNAKVREQFIRFKLENVAGSIANSIHIEVVGDACKEN